MSAGESLHGRFWVTATVKVDRSYAVSPISPGRLTEPFSVISIPLVSCRSCRTARAVRKVGQSDSTVGGRSSDTTLVGRCRSPGVAWSACDSTQWLRSQVAKAVDCKSTIPGSNPGGASFGSFRFCQMGKRPGAPEWRAGPLLYRGAIAGARDFISSLPRRDPAAFPPSGPGRAAADRRA